MRSIEDVFAARISPVFRCPAAAELGALALASASEGLSAPISTFIC